MDFFHRGILRGFLFLYPAKVYGKENIPKGKAVIVCNHFRAIDCGFVAKAYPTDIKFLAKKELFKGKYVSSMLKRFGAIPIDRESPDMSSIIQVMKYLKEEHKVCIFPEGTRNKTNTNELQPLKNGFIIFATKTSSPIVPMMILNKGKLFRRTRLAVGKPIYFEEYFGKKIDDSIQEQLSNIVRDNMINLQQSMSDIMNKNGKNKQ